MVCGGVSGVSDKGGGDLCDEKFCLIFVGSAQLKN